MRSSLCFDLDAILTQLMGGIIRCVGVGDVIQTSRHPDTRLSSSEVVNPDVSRAAIQIHIEMPKQGRVQPVRGSL